MTAKEIIENEWECVRRANDGECDRECEKCDLVMPSIDILVAYDIACDALDKQIPKKPISGCCPDCGVLLKKFAPYTYCAKCGRKLDAPWCEVEK